LDFFCIFLFAFHFHFSFPFSFSIYFRFFSFSFFSFCVLRCAYPALFYIVPLMLLPLCLVARCRGHGALLWSGQGDAEDIQEDGSSPSAASIALLASRAVSPPQQPCSSNHNHHLLRISIPLVQPVADVANEQPSSSNAAANNGTSSSSSQPQKQKQQQRIISVV
jgi:hypothetical protein